MATAVFKGIVLKIEAPLVMKTGFVKQRIHFRPSSGKVFFPEVHRHNMELLSDIHEGDQVTLTIRIHGSGNHKINNIVVENITREALV